MTTGIALSATLPAIRLGWHFSHWSLAISRLAMHPGSYTQYSKLLKTVFTVFTLFKVKIY